MLENSFENIVINWYTTNKRDLPWRNTQDPYLIWISEIMLQQTRVNQCLPYFNRFVSRFPTISSLAQAPIDEVLKHWEGLGYYSRARNIHFTAKYIHENLGGNFPTTFNEIIKLKGIGPYTSSAISSFAFKEKVAVVDGNVFRVLARYFNIDLDIALGSSMKYFQDLANELIPESMPDTFNQAIMEFGAIQCVPQNPNCEICPLQKNCEAFHKKLVDILPIKIKKLKIKNRTLNYFWVQSVDNKILVNKRKSGDIWEGLYELILIEKEASVEDLMIDLQRIIGDNDLTLTQAFGPINHQLTHQKLTANFYVIQYKNQFKSNMKEYQIIDVAEFETLPKSVLSIKFLQKWQK